MFKKPAYIIIFSIVTFVSLFILSYNTSTFVKSAADHIVISEVQIAGAAADDEFIELYNPRDIDVDISGWRLTRKTQSGTESNLVSSLSGSISSHGYFLIANPDYDDVVTPDATYSATSNAIANHNTVVLYSDAGSTIVDRVGMGDAGEFEGNAPAATPSANMSVERKASASSTAESMALGGVDENMGNGEDTDDNSNDFLIREISEPQNSSSSPEPAETTGSPTPTDEMSPTPTDEVSPTPTEEVSPTPTEEVSPTPTESLIPTPTETETPTPTSSPTPEGMIIARLGFPGNQKVCTLNYKVLKVGFILMVFPYVSCM